MKKLATSILIAATLAACSGHPAPNGGQTRFLLLVHVPLAGQLSSAPDAQLLDIGHRACAEMDKNTPSDQIVADVGGNPEPGSEAFNAYSYVVVAAATQLCPTHKQEFTNVSIPAG
ncbi:MAG: DUF732 domain-containing protein [Actinomycetota bacterium]